ncbi:class B sortase [Cohnella herbarum]|uniref:Class B sortase n=1 Tax=Cohnella herbarum TaxID=2728023 RepID=A0A7Z2ZP29_9BACL|nr:class B sortase [Cohnella herbarum]QJD87036.1 class B sortase [Cohnella herbarum]
MRIGIKIRMNERSVRTSLLVTGAVVLLFSLYKIGVYAWDGYENKKTYEGIRDAYYEEPIVQGAAPKTNPATDQAKPISVAVSSAAAKIPANLEFNAKFADLVKLNEDIVGWVKIDETRIDYPVVQAEDNDFYLSNDVNRKSNVAGSIFMDYRNKVGEANRNTILYGHDMKNKTMFAGLIDYESRWNFENKALIEFDTIYGDAKWVIFSAYTTDSSFDYIKTEFGSDEEFQVFLDTVQAKSLHASDVKVTAKDTILTLSTCSSAYEDARFVVHAVRLDDVR